MKIRRRIVLAAAVAVLLPAVTYWFVAWNVRRSLRKVQWHELAELIKAPLSEAGTRTAVVEEPVPTPSSAQQSKASGWAHAKPGEVAQRAQVADTYTSALAVGKAASELLSHGGRLPATSLAISALAANHQLDAWGHAFCLHEQSDRIAVVSTGSKEPTLSCAEIQISSRDIGRLRPGRLYRYPSGALVLVFAPSRERPSL